MIEVSVREFKSLITPVLPLAAEDKGMFPLLSAVQIRTFDGKLAAIATDRYRIGMQLSDIEVDLPDLVIPSSAAKLILKSFPGNKTFDAQLQISVKEDGKVRVTGETGNKWCPSLTLEIEQPAGEYPNLTEILSESYHRPKVATAGVNLNIFSGFAAATGVGGGASIEIADGSSTKPVVVRVDDSFFGIIMPLRGLGTSNERFDKLFPAA